MSRLHECLVKGVDNVPSTPHWAGVYATVGERMQDLYLKAVESPRKGTRNKTKRKTAKVQGLDFQDVRPWKVRNSGIISAKSQKQKGLKKAAKLAAETMKGDTKKA